MTSFASSLLFSRFDSLGPFAPFALVAMVGLAPSASAGDGVPDRWLVTTTSVIDPAVGLIDGDDVCLVQVGFGSLPHTHTGRGHWFAQAGFDPGDVDGLGLLPAGLGMATRGSLGFSLQSNEGGFLDGDVLRVGPGGTLEVVVPEASFLGALGIPDSGIDLDALDFDGMGRVVFSVQNNLTGTALGDVSNGDIMRLETDGGITRLYTEAQVQVQMDVAMVNAGLVPGALGDVHGLAYFDGELFVAVQSPSSVDGAMLRLGAAPLLVGDELGLGLMGTELDGLVALDGMWDVGVVGLDVASSMPGTSVQGSGRGFTPGAPVLLFMAGQPGFGLDLGLGGFSDVYIDLNDPWMLASYAAEGFTARTADAMGQIDLTFDLPAGEWGGSWLGGQGWSFQGLDMANAAMTAPFRVQLF